MVYIMKSSGHSVVTAAVALALALSCSKPVPAQEYTAPLLGVPLDFDAFPDLNTIDAKGIDRFLPGRVRILGRAKVGDVELVYVWREYPVYPDDKRDGVEPLGFEADNGSVARVAGGWITPLWASDGDLFVSYPEVKESLVEELLSSYIKKMIGVSGSKSELQALIDMNRNCDMGDGRQLALLSKFDLTCPE